eukprot:TRINITY_DN12305_c0_g1_i1.p1 TRINITY_DN12305_c0_g1~~TRINITY_DN12305_c0_g1_i1.p1  ORF type:complete len:158 (-),score=61.12 TRINITY_DN12305_c0_g1_i1:52-504(-)
MQEHPEPKPILKKRQADKPQKKGLVWDEENLIETSLERGTRTKIDEVDTPYHYPGDYSISSDSQEDSDEEPQQQAPVLSLDDLARKLEVEKQKQDEGEELVVNADRKTEEERAAFLKKRKLHYAEGLAWKSSKKPSAAISKEGDESEQKK